MKRSAQLRWPVRALPQLRKAGRFPMGENSRNYVYVAPTHALHQHDYHADFCLGNQRLQLQPGDVTLTPSGIESCYELPQNGFHFCIHFEVELASTAAVALPLHWRPGSQAAFVTTRLRHIIAMFRQSQQTDATGKLARIASGAALQELLLWLAFASSRRESGVAAQRSQAGVDRLVLILDERFDEPLTVAALAAEVGLSQNYLAQMFRQRMGVTIQQYLANRRIELAHHLLTTTRLPVKQIAAEVGLPDPQHFNKQFRRLTGLSPSSARSRAV